MRVLITATSCRPHYGGPAFFIANLASTLAEAGARVSLWAADGSAPESPLLNSDKVTRLDGPIQTLVDAMNDADVVHDHGIWLRHNHKISVLATQMDLARLVTTHGMLDPWCFEHKGLKKKLAWKIYQKNDLRQTSLLHATSDVEAANLEALDLGVPISIIPIGVDIPDGVSSRSHSEIRCPERVAVYLGRLHPVKGLPMLIEAWHRVRPSCWRLEIAGPDVASHRQSLEEAVSLAGLDNTISFVGPKSGTAKQSFLLDADLFILPSHSESFGLAIAEALAHGVPVLTTTAAPWSRLEELRCGWSVPPTVDALAHALRNATAKPQESLQEMGMRGRDWVKQNLGWGQIAAMFLDRYDECLAHRTD